MGQGCCLASGTMRPKALCCRVGAPGFVGSRCLERDDGSHLPSRPPGWSAGLVEPLPQLLEACVAASALFLTGAGSLPTGKGVHFALASCRCSLLGWHFTAEI